MIDLEQGLELQRDGIEAFLRLLARCSEGGHNYDVPGVVASVLPVTPTHSVANSVVYDDAGQLENELHGLATHYEEAGVEAWTVWVPERDRAAAKLLSAAGHVLDADPAAMVLELSELGDPPPEAADLDWDSDASGPEVGWLNDHAYGFDHPAFELALANIPDDGGLHLYRARVDGELACVLTALDVDSDCVPFFVGTHRDHRGRGLARELLRVTLLEARERGVETSSLQATKLGEPVYERLGYRTICALEMWERRPGAAAL